jgi:methyltransferase
MVPALLGVVVFGVMIVEARRAASNERMQRARGGVEAPRDVYPLMQIAYPGIFVAMLAEGAWRAIRLDAATIAGIAIFLAAKGLKWWAITSLGQAWTFRVIVVPGMDAIASGPYRFVRHPNYIAVVGEIAGIALAAHARITGPLAMAGFGALLACRVAVENRALAALTRRK